MENLDSDREEEISEEETETVAKVHVEWICPKCKKQFKHQTSYCRHVKSNCGETKSFACTGCPKSFDRRDSLSRHAKSCKGSEAPKWECGKCSKQFQFNAYLKRHEKSCGNNCPTCRKTMRKGHVCKSLLYANFNRKERKRKHEESPLSSSSCSISSYEVPENLWDMTDLAMWSEYEPRCFERIDFSMQSDWPGPSSATQVEAAHAIEEPVATYTGIISLDEDEAAHAIEEPVGTSSGIISLDEVPSNTLSKRRQRLAEKVTTHIQKKCREDKTDPVDVLKLVVTYLKLEPQVAFSGDINFRLPFESRSKVWKFWGDNSEESTLTTRPAKMKVTSKPRFQNGLDFPPTVEIVTIRNRQYYQSIWKVTTCQLLLLYKKFCDEFPNNLVSKGTFFNLKPFNIRNASKKDMEMCLCKLHLHIQWAFEALLLWSKKVEIEIGALTYRDFLSKLMMDCPKEQHTHISWTCTPNRKCICAHIEKNWSDMKELLFAIDKGNVCVPFKEFQSQLCYNAKGEALKNKEGKDIKKLVAVSHQVPVGYIIQFIEELLPEVVHHRNKLRLFRNVKKMFMALFTCIYMDVDFSENLTIDIKWEPQSLHWSKKQVTIHSGIVKTSDGQKTYHPYVSDTREHDQPFVSIAINKMMSTTDANGANVILIESDNCSSQYKSAEHFHDLQKLSNEEDKIIIPFYGVEGHGKGEVDHVGGIAKVNARDEMTRGTIFDNASQIVTHLIQHFGNHESPDYHIKEVTVEELEEERALRRRKVYKTIDGSSFWQVMVFKPGQPYFFASTRLCVCDQCCEDYGSCDLFSSYELSCETIREIPLRSDVTPPQPEELGNEDNDGFILPESYVAIAADSTDKDALWFVKVIEANKSSVDRMEDGYHNVIPKGVTYFTGYFLEREHRGKRCTFFNLKTDKKTYFYKESVLFPFVNIVEDKNKLVLRDEDYTDILMYVEQSGFTHL